MTKDYFQKLPDDLMNNENLNSHEKLIYIICKSFEHAPKGCRISNSYLMLRTGIKDNRTITKYLDIGEGILFKGTRTYHGVEKSTDANMKRYMIGWQYTTDPSIEDISLCSKFRGESVIQIAKMLAPNILLTLCGSYILSKYLDDQMDIMQRKILIKSTIAVVLMSFTLPGPLRKYNFGTGLNNVPTCLAVICALSLASFGNIDFSLLFINYLLLTEMFIPSKFVTYHLKKVE